MTRAEALLAAIFMRANYPLSPNSKRWLSITLPEDVIAEFEAVMAEMLERHEEAR